MNDFTKRLVFFLVLAGIAGSISLYYARYLKPKYGPDSEIMEQCVKALAPRAGNETSALSACECARTELERQKLTLRDLLGGKNAQASKVGDSCIAMSI